MKFLENMEELEAIYNAKPTLAPLAKEIDHLIPEYREVIAASPFVHGAGGRNNISRQWPSTDFSR